MREKRSGQQKRGRKGFHSFCLFFSPSPPLLVAPSLRFFPSPHLPFSLSVLLLLLLGGCAAGIPASVLQTVSQGVSFRDVRRQPQAYRGHILTLGGIVTAVETSPEGYLATVREFPLDGGGRQRPVRDFPSGGSFLLRIPPDKHPAGLLPGAEITVVGGVIGTAPRTGDDGAEELPLLVERYLRVWGPSWWPRLQIGIGGSISL